MADEKERDERLWRIARKRANFRRSFFVYVVINAFLWGVWWFTTGRNSGVRGYPWPIWVMLGWGIGIAFSISMHIMDPNKIWSNRNMKN